MRLVGRWRIVAMSGWDRDAIDLVEPGFIELDRTGPDGSASSPSMAGWTAAVTLLTDLQALAEREDRDDQFT
jgi:hypothetical protein